MFANIRVKEPLERVVEDWDYLAERVLPSFSTLKVIGQNNMGIRRRVVSTRTWDDPRKGAISNLEIGPSGIVQVLTGPLDLAQSARELNCRCTPVPRPTTASRGYI